MIKNYLLIAWRNIARHRLYAAINVLGLALGMTVCILIFLWVRDEKSVDDLGPAGKDLYILYESYTGDGTTGGTYTTPLHFEKNMPAPYIEGMRGSVPGIERIAYYKTGYELPWGYPETLQVGDKTIKQDGARAGEDFFKMFPYPIVEGNAATILHDMKGIALSRRTAVALFGSPHAAMGRTIRLQNQTDFTVSGVFEDLPANSSLHFDFLNNWEAQRTGLLNWAENSFITYVQLAPGADRKQIEDGMTRYLLTAMGPIKGVTVRLGLQKVSDQYLYNVFSNGRPATGRIEYVRIFSGVAVFILLIACINFMNLATARSVKRAKEVGLRKVVGSSRLQLIGQFFGESLLFALLAMALSVGFVAFLLPVFNQFTGKSIRLPFSGTGSWLSLLAIVAATGLVAGSYPALYLSSLRPVRVLKGVLTFTRASVVVRKGLTVFQFVLSTVLLIATIVITRQTDYVQHSNLGYDRENLVYVRVEGALSTAAGYRLFRQRASTMPGIAMVDRSSETPHSMNFDVTDPIQWEGKPKDSKVAFVPASVGYDFIPLMHLSVIKGRDFSRLNPTDSSDAFIVNEEAVKEMGMKDPIGKSISAWHKKGHIVGIVKDYHTRSLREPIKPVILDVKEDLDFGVVMIRTRPGQTKQALASLAAVYKQVNPNLAFAYQFVDEEYQKMYNSELMISKLSVLFATLAIIISCLGLLGLVLFAAEQRTREIGIRKVLGATLPQIVTLFSVDFLGLVGLAFLIAVPVAWFFMNSWLHDFAYRIALSAWIFAGAGAAVAVVAMLTVSYQAVRAAMANPVNSLRSE
ncbi:MAG TPA: ABC transporter permease [Puia sp.]|uniref:ABC transporter permease n=1 Tax=Puia sp. TaxID=2045100 RepID=UPI002B57C9DF|nr:ABC transporter permease [Puia sp.]HVU96939.1 ABC transporter permease [Puia sp.]